MKLRRFAQAATMSVMLAADQPGIGRAGETITLALAPSDVTIQEELDSYIAGFSPFGLRADEVSPIFLVDKDTDKFRFFSLNNVFQKTNVEGSRRSRVRQIDPESTLLDYTVLERQMGTLIPKVTEAQANFDVKQVSSEVVARSLGLDRESRVWTTLRNTASWNANNRVTLVNPWDDILNSDPIQDIQDRVEASAQPVTDIWMAPPGGHIFLRHPATRDHMRQMLGDNAPQAQAVRGAGVQMQLDFVIPGFPPFHIVPEKELNETTGLLDYILGDDVVLTCNPPGSERNRAALRTIQTFRRRGASGTGYTTREFMVEEEGLEGSTMLAAGHAEDVKMVSDICGGLIKNVKT